MSFYKQSYVRAWLRGRIFTRSSLNVIDGLYGYGLVTPRAQVDGAVIMP